MRQIIQQRANGPTGVGSTNRRADPVSIEEMRGYGRVSSLDEQPLTELTSEATDFRAASEFFQVDDPRPAPQ